MAGNARSTPPAEHPRRTGVSDRDCYKILGVPRSATDDEIKTAYRRLAMRLHPDRNDGDSQAEDKFKRVKNAYETLSNRSARARHDAGGEPRRESDNRFFDDMFEDVWKDLKGDKNTEGHPAKQKLVANISITLNEAVLGSARTIKAYWIRTCEPCSGTGRRREPGDEECEKCAGTGKRRYKQGMFSIEHLCEECAGAGSRYAKICKECSGEGNTRATRTLRIEVPAGTHDGTQLRMVDQVGTNATGAQVSVNVTVLPHEVFTRKGSDLLREVKITMPEAMLGGEIKVRTLERTVKVKVPQGTQNAVNLKLTGMGVNTGNEETPGDMICTIKIVTPNQLDDEQRKIVEQLAQTMRNNEKPR